MHEQVWQMEDRPQQGRGAHTNLVTSEKRNGLAFGRAQLIWGSVETRLAVEEAKWQCSKREGGGEEEGT